MNGFLPWLALVGALAIILGLLALLRYLGYKRTIALAEQGHPRPSRTAGRGLLRWGILLTTVGLALALVLYSLGLAADSYPLHLGPWMLGGFVPLFLGLGLVLLHFLTQKG